jgi:hypothetical protein
MSLSPLFPTFIGVSLSLKTEDQHGLFISYNIHDNLIFNVPLLYRRRVYM